MNPNNAKRRLTEGRAISEDQAVSVLREMIERDYGDSFPAAAKAWKVTREYLYMILRGERTIGMKLQRALGIRRVVTVKYFSAAALPGGTDHG